MINLKNINKAFRVVKRKKGMAAAARAMLKRDYNEIQALDNISFSVRKGEIAGLIGPNGAGKSTAIKVMSGILVPDSGECTILGCTPWKNRKKYVSEIGVMFGHRTQLWWDVPAQDSYDLLRDIYSIDEKIYREKLDELSEILDIGNILHTPLRQMSLGQRIRCEIAASLLHSPQILFLDEPTIGLDAVSKLAVRQFIKKLNAMHETTIILTTHDMGDIEALTDRILLIGKGKLVYDGSMRKIREDYDRLRTLAVSFEERHEPVTPDGAELVAWRNTHAVYRLDISKVNISSILSELGKCLTIFDMTLETSPIEEIIASFYRDMEI
jgi:ABC-2 type transport system ATP-binding protein